MRGVLPGVEDSFAPKCTSARRTFDVGEVLTRLNASIAPLEHALASVLLSMSEMIVAEIEDGRLVSGYGAWDRLGLLAQMIQG